MNLEDQEKLKLDPDNECKPYIFFDKSERCARWGNHDVCDGVIHFGKFFHIYCNCDCHKQANG